MSARPRAISPVVSALPATPVEQQRLEAFVRECLDYIAHLEAKLVHLSALERALAESGQLQRLEAAS